MPPVTRRAGARPAARNERPTSSGYRGAEGLRRMREEEQAATARREAAKMNSSMPFRFYCPVGESREIVVIDDNLQDVFFRFEHNLKNRRSGKWDIFCACVAENANCPVCREAERPAYFAMYLTVIDLTPYENKDGIEVPWSKKLLVVKTAQQKKITRLAERYGTLRGMVLQMTRDGEKDASIGNDIEYIEHMSEDDLLAYETSYEYEDSSGAKKVKEIIGHEAFDYDELFPMPTEQQLRAIVGGSPEPGSREEERSVRGRGRSDGGDGWDGEDQPKSRIRRVPRGRQEEISEDDNPATGAEDAEDDERPQRGRAAPRTASRAPTRTASRAPTRTERTSREEEPDYAEDDPPQRTRPAARPAARGEAPARGAVARRPARPDPEADAEVEEERPSRGAASLAERRRALRR